MKSEILSKVREKIEKVPEIRKISEKQDWDKISENIKVVNRFAYFFSDFVNWAKDGPSAGIYTDGHIMINARYKDCDFILMHELMHYLSAKENDNLGVCYCDESMALNEYFTDYITHQIILGEEGIKKRNSYRGPYFLIEDFVKDIGKETFLDIYFSWPSEKVKELFTETFIYETRVYFFLYLFEECLNSYPYTDISILRTMQRDLKKTAKVIKEKTKERP